MKAFTLDEFDNPPRPRDDLPEPPEPAGGELTVRVHGSSVNPVDAAVAAGMLRGMADYTFPVTLGRDFAGVVEAVGPEVEGQAVGDGVFGFLLHADPDVRRGAWSELTNVPADRYLAIKPASLSFSEAGAAPLAGVTALAAMEAVGPESDDSVLIVGATGGVGSFAVQLAKLAGARVIAPGLPEDKEYLSALGVDEVVPRDGDVAAAVREVAPAGVAALIDTVSRASEALDVYAQALAEDGRVASPVGAAGEGPGRHNVMGSADPAGVEKLAALLEAGTLEVPIQRRYPLEEAGTAMADLAERHTQGKIAISVAPTAPG
jgi:NADPH2:quinone reductase